MIKQMRTDEREGGIVWLALTDAVMDRVESVVADLSPEIYLRSADALHLACAAENGLGAIHSNDRHLLSAAPHFGLRGINILA